MIGSLFTLQVDDQFKLEILEQNKHIKLFYQIVQENKEFLLRFTPNIESIKSEEDVEYFIRYSYDRFRKFKTDLKLGIFEKDDLIGCISVDFEYENNKSELGYWLIAKKQGQGIMKKVLEPLMNYLFDKYYIHKIVIIIDINNEPSIKLANKLNFKKEGTLKDHLLIKDKYITVHTFAKFKDE